MASEEWTAFVEDEPLDVKGKKLQLFKDKRMRPLGTIAKLQSQPGDHLVLTYGPALTLPVDTAKSTLRRLGPGWYEFQSLDVGYLIMRQL